MMEMYYDKETLVIFNKLVNDFYSRFLFNIDSLSQDVLFLFSLMIFFSNNSIPEVLQFLISKWVQVITMQTT